MLLSSKSKVITELQRFAISGIAGFAVDAGIVLVSTTILGVSPLPAQILAFSFAVTVTWLFNRHWTFAEHANDKWLHEWTRYVAANSIGAAVNNGIYHSGTHGSIVVKKPHFAVAAGSIAGMIEVGVGCREKVAGVGAKTKG